MGSEIRKSPSICIGLNIREGIVLFHVSLWVAAEEGGSSFMMWD